MKENESKTFKYIKKDEQTSKIKNKELDRSF